MAPFDNILRTIGRTPIVRINRLFPSSASAFVKLERANPGGSIKDRIALSMIEDAERRGLLKEGSVIIEPTSGNTGVGLAMVAAVKRMKLVLVMPESMSIERRRLMAAYGAQLELTPRAKGMPGAIARAQEMVAADPNAWMPSQFDNPANVAVHEETTALEILEDMPGGPDVYITGVGTGGHLTVRVADGLRPILNVSLPLTLALHLESFEQGVARVLKRKNPNMKVFAVEPLDSPVISGGSPSPHPIQGVRAFSHVCS